MTLKSEKFTLYIYEFIIVNFECLRITHGCINDTVFKTESLNIFKELF